MGQRVLPTRLLGFLVGVDLLTISIVGIKMSLVVVTAHNG